MHYLNCGNIKIPLCLVDSFAWTKTARTVMHTGGYISSRGFEAAEISVRVGVDNARCFPNSLDFAEMVEMIDGIKTDRTSPSGVFYLGGYAIYPELEFSLTNINKTYSSDMTGKPSEIEIDMVFSGVKAVKEVVRNRALELEPFSPMPEVVLTVDGKELRVQDCFQINSFVTQPDSINLSLSIGSDMDLVSRDGFLTKILDNGTIKASLPQGETVYYIIDADLVEERLSLTGSIYPPKAMQVLSRTYSDTSLKAVIEDLAKEAGIECDCLVDGKIDYYLAFAPPMDCLREIQAGAGFIMSYRSGKLTCAPVPMSITGLMDVDYIQLTQDSNRERLRGLYWYDGINQFSAGQIDSTAYRLQSPFRSTQNYAPNCLSFQRFTRNVIEVQSDINERIDAYSAVTVRSNDAVLDCVVSWFEFDWVAWSMTLELHYVG